VFSDTFFLLLLVKCLDALCSAEAYVELRLLRLCSVFLVVNLSNFIISFLKQLQ
jgi:hypothetical protein